jgi:hypothetical protein
MLILWTAALLLWWHDESSRREPLLSVFDAAVGLVGVTLLLRPVGAKAGMSRLSAGALLMSFVVLLGMTFVDWPVWPDSLPNSLRSSGHRDEIARFHCYYLGGVIDHDWLWRIDAKPDVLKAIATKLELRHVDIAAPDFWLMPPFYWPQSLPPGAQLYSTPGFSHGSGDQYFMLVDVQRGRAVVWVKSLFG